MLEERIDPGGATSREYARIARLVARELGMDELTIGRVAVAAHLVGLDRALRREVGGETNDDYLDAFAPSPDVPGGLNPTLRQLGARVLGLRRFGDEPPSARLVRLVCDYVELRAQAADDSSDAQTLVELLRTTGADSVLLDALSAAVESDDALPQTTKSKLGESGR
jgi:hypothetical protein